MKIVRYVMKTFFLAGILLTANPAFAWYQNQTQRLHQAIARNDTMTALDAIRKGAYLFNDYSDERETLLMVAAQKGNVDVFMELVKRGFNLHYRDARGRTTLHHAVMGGNLAIIRFLYERGPTNPYVYANSYECSEEVNFFQLAVCFNKLEAAKYFYEKNKGILYVTTKDGRDVFSCVRSNHDKWYEFFIQQARYLPLNRYEEIGERNLKYLKTAFSNNPSYFKENPNLVNLVARKGDMDFLKKILALGIDMNRVSSAGKSLLMDAIEGGNEKIVQLILQAAPNVNYVNQFGDSAIKAAARQGNPQIVKMLLDQKAILPPDILHVICEKKWKPGMEKKAVDILRLLQSQGANLNYRNAEGWNLLQVSLARRNLDIIRFLLGTPLLATLEAELPATLSALYDEFPGKPDEVLNVVRELEKAKVSLYYKKKGNVKKANTILHHAISKRDLKTVEYVLKNKLEDPSIQNEEGKTPLMHLLDLYFCDLPEYEGDSCQEVEMVNLVKDQVRMAEWLIQEGSSLQIPDSQGNTPIVFALFRRGYEIAKSMTAKLDEKGINAVRMKGGSLDLPPDYLYEGMTPLMIAASVGRMDLVQSLLARGALIQKRDPSMKNAINHAAANGRTNIVALLEKKYQARLSAFDAIQKNDMALALKIIRREGQDYNDEGRTPLQEAIVRDRVDIVKALLQEGLGTWLEDAKNRSVAWYLMKYRMERLLPLAISDPKDIVRPQGPERLSVMDLAIEQEDIDALKAIYQKAPQAFFLDDWEFNPIRKAVLYRRPGVLDFLNQVGVNTRVYLRGQNVMLDLVRRTGNAAITAKFAQFEARDNNLIEAINREDENEILKWAAFKNVNQRLDERDFLSHALVRTCKTKVLEALRQGLNPARNRNAEGKTLMHLAVERCPHTFIAQLDSVVESRASEYENIHLALSEQTPSDVVDFVFSRAPNVSGKGPDGNPLIHTLVKTCNERILERISSLEMFQRRNEAGDLPLAVAVPKCPVSYLKAYIEKTQNYLLLDKKGRSLAQLCILNRREDCIPLFSREMLAYRDQEGLTPLWMALQFMSPEAQQKILDLQYEGSPVVKGSIELCLAAQNNKPDIVEKLKQLNVSLMLPCDVQKHSPLMVAVLGNAGDAIRILIAYGVDKEQENVQGNTALHLAVLKRNLEAIRVLLAAGAKSDKPNRDGDTPEMLARNRQINLALLAGADSTGPAEAESKGKENQKGGSGTEPPPEDQEPMEDDGECSGCL